MHFDESTFSIVIVEKKRQVRKEWINNKVGPS